MESFRILLIEDDLELMRFLREQFVGDGLQVYCANSLAQAHEMLTEFSIDVMVVDRMLPDGDGADWLKTRSASQRHIPTILLTALGSIADKVSGLKNADDYLVKPFEYAELQARVESLLRRSKSTDELTIFMGDLKIDRLRHNAQKNLKTIPLKPMEYKLLEYLATHTGSIVTKKMILAEVWGLTFDPSTNIVETYMSRLRTQLKEVQSTVTIKTLRGKGYHLET